MIKIRMYNAGDKEALQALFTEFLGYKKKSYDKKAFAFDDILTSKKKAYVKKITGAFTTTPNSNLFVAEESNKAVGYIFGSVQEYSFRKMSKAGHIRHFFVSQNSRNKGAGKRLFTALAQWLKKQGCAALVTDVFSGNTKTLSLYRKWGFLETKVKMKRKI